MYLAVDSVNNFTQFLTLILIFIFVLVLTYFSTKFVANYQKGNMSNSNISLIEGARLNQNKYIQLVRIGKKYYALAVSKDNVSVICEVPSEELNLEGDNLPGVSSFGEILAKFKKNDDEKLISENKEDFISVNNDDSGEDVNEK